MRVSRWMTTAALLGSAMPMTAHAQQTPPPETQTAPETQATDTPEASSGIEDIVVTAQRRSESAQRAAVAIDVVAPTTLQNAGVVTATSLNAAVPSLYVARGGGANTSFFIRGVGNFTNNGYSDPAVAFNVDGVYYGRPTSTTGTFYDLDRVEVLKGPQGTLYGRNATGGAINIVPAKPKLGQTSGFVSAGYGRFDSRDVEGALNLPLGKQFALRVSGKVFDTEGYYKDGTGDEVGEAARVQLLGELTDALTVRVAGDYSHTGGFGTGYSFTGQFRPTGSATAATATAPAGYTFTPSGLDERSGLLSPEGRAYFAAAPLGGPRIFPAPLNTPYQNNRYYGTNAEITLRTEVGTLTVIPAYRVSKIDNLFNGPAFRGGLVAETDKQFSTEARFDGKAIGAIDWLIGGFYYDETIKAQYTFSQYTVQTFQKFDTGTESYAAFGRLTAHLGEKARLVGGVRYTSDSKTFDANGRNLVQICTVPASNPAGCFGGPSAPVARTYEELATLIPASQLPNGLPTTPGVTVPFGSNGNRLLLIPVVINTQLKASKVTYRLAAEYDVAPASLLYLSYETGYRSGGFNFSLGRESYKPEFITALTFGSKNRFFDNRLQVNFEAFQWKYRDQQVAHFGLDSTGNNSAFSENIGRSRIRGFELDVQGKATPTTTLRGGIQHLDNKLTSFVYNVGQSSVPLVGCPYTPSTDQFGRASYRVDCSGKPGFNAPKWAGNIGFQQEAPLGDYTLTFTGDGRYRGNRIIGFEYLPQQNSGSDFTVDASVMLADAAESWSLTAWVRNLTDNTVPVLAQFAGSTGNIVTTGYTPPRTYGLRARFNF